MKILYITTGAGTMYCGSCLRDAALANALKAQGHEILFVPTYTPLKIETKNIAVNRIFYGGLNVYLQQKSRVFRWMPRFMAALLDRPFLLRFISRFSHMTAAKDLAELTISVLKGEEGKQKEELHKLVEWAITQPRPDIIVLPNSLFAGLAPALKKALLAPVVCLLSGEDMFIDDFPAPHRDEAHALLKKQVARLDACVAPNQYYAGFMREYLDLAAEKMLISPIGIDVSDYPDPPPDPPKAFTIGYFARICPQKGLRMLAEAFRILKKRPGTVNYRLKVGGYLGKEFRPYFEAIRKDIKEWGLASSFDYAGELTRKQKVQLLTTLSAFSVPTVYPEPKGQFVPEALAAGVPVVLPRIGCLTEWIEATGGGVLVEPENPEALANALEALAKNPAEARRFGEAGREAVHARFTSAAMAEGMVEIFSKVSK